MLLPLVLLAQAATTTPSLTVDVADLQRRAEVCVRLETSTDPAEQQRLAASAVAYFHLDTSDKLMQFARECTMFLQGLRLGHDAALAELRSTAASH